jgi:hypothetical protein
MNGNYDVISPCSFCNYEHPKISDISQNEFCIVCPKCKAQGPRTSKKGPFILKWNTRFERHKPAMGVGEDGIITNNLDDLSLPLIPIGAHPGDDREVLLYRREWGSILLGYYGVICEDDDNIVMGWILSHEGYGFDPGVQKGLLGWDEDIEDEAMPTHYIPLENYKKAYKDRYNNA